MSQHGVVKPALALEREHRLIEEVGVPAVALVVFVVALHGEDHSTKRFGPIIHVERLGHYKIQMSIKPVEMMDGRPAQAA